MQQFEERCVGPSETDYVHVVSQFGVGFGGFRYDVVLLANLAVAAEILRYRRQEFLRDPIGIIVVSIAP